MTALVGRVPVQGEVRDPMPFKVITGADNLAANGLRVPGVQGMVWSGTAIGDWTLSCVTGRLDSVTFVFEDGTIRTISGDDQSTPGGGAEKPLGWISDAQGIPCITGERKTNAPAFLTQRMGVMALQAARDVYTRRGEGLSIWVVKSDQIIASDPQTKDEFFEPTASKVWVNRSESVA